MARDDAARDTEIERSPLDRRSSHGLAHPNAAAVTAGATPSTPVSADARHSAVDGDRAASTTEPRFENATVPEGHYGTQ